MTDKKTITDYDLEAVMGRLLIVGVAISGILILIGGVTFLINEGLTQPHFKTFRGLPQNLKSVKQILAGFIHFDSLSVIQTGLLLLIATPIARVVFSIIGFFFERDYLYVLISAIVLAIIAYSIFSLA